MNTEDLAQRLWSNGGELKGPVVEAYYGWRGLAVPKTDSLRFVASLKHKSGASYPAIIARAENAEGDMTGVQRTFLAPDGSGKAPVDKKLQKMSLGRVRGSSVRLADLIDGAPLLFGEGVETTITTMQATGYPGFAALGTAGLKAVDPPDSVNDVVLLGENDDGKSAAAIARVAPELKQKGIRVRVAYPPAGFKDFNDMVMGAADRIAAFAAVRRAIEDAEDWVDLPGGDSAEDPPQAVVLFNLAKAQCEFFRDENRVGYATILHALHEGGTHRETHKLRSTGFRESLIRSYYLSRNGKGIPNDVAIKSAVGLMVAFARIEGGERRVFVRRAAHAGKLYVDLCDDRWRAVEIDASDWRIVDEPPVLFLRAPGMLALPDPKRCDPKKGIARLRKLMRARTNGDFVIIVACLLDMLGGRGPYTVLFFTGEAGATKTSHAKMVRALTDPSTKPVRSMPKEVRDVYIAAKNAVVVYNNLSSLPNWLSDIFCVITEGSTDSRRELFTDEDESSISVCSPLVLTSISNIITKGDLGARTLYAVLTPVPDHERKTDVEVWQEFHEAAPEILGALLAGLSVGLQRLPTIKTILPRMANFAQFAMACEAAFWEPGTFAAAYEVNAQNAVAEAVDANIAVSTFRDFMEDIPDGKWVGTATRLFTALTDRIRKPEHDAVEAHKKAVADKDADLRVLTEAKLREAQQAVRDVINSGWPKKSHFLTHELKIAGPQLRKLGIHITWPTNNHDRNLSILLLSKSPDSASLASPASMSGAGNNGNNDLSERLRRSSRPNGEADSEAAPVFQGAASASSRSFGDVGGDESGKIGEARGNSGRLVGQTQNVRDGLNARGSSTDGEAGEARKSESGSLAPRPLSESMSTHPEPESPKNEAKPTKRIIPL